MNEEQNQDGCCKNKCCEESSKYKFATYDYMAITKPAVKNPVSAFLGRLRHFTNLDLIVTLAVVAYLARGTIASAVSQVAPFSELVVAGILVFWLTRAR